MNNEIIQQLTAVIRALDSIAVTGQQNRGNLYGSIETLKEITRKLASEATVHDAERNEIFVDK